MDLKPFPESFYQVMEFRETLNVETNRGVALVCAAYVEEELKSLLEKTFVDDPKTVKRLFEYSGPLGTFSSKIDLAFITGSIGADAHRGLHLIRKIRNSFAHYHKGRSFSDQDIASQCGELTPLSPFPEEKDSRKLFIRASITILAAIHAKTFTANHTDTADCIDVRFYHGAFGKVKAMVAKLIAMLPVDDQEKLIRSEEHTSELQ